MISYRLYSKILSYEDKKRKRIFSKIESIGDEIYQLLGDDKIDKIELLDNLLKILSNLRNRGNDYISSISDKNTGEFIGNYGGYYKEGGTVYHLASLGTCNNHQNIPGLSFANKKIKYLGTALLFGIINGMKANGVNKVEIEFAADVKDFYKKSLYYLKYIGIIKDYKNVNKFQEYVRFDKILGQFGNEGIMTKIEIFI